MTFDITTTNTGPTLVDTRTYHTFSELARMWSRPEYSKAFTSASPTLPARRQGERVAQWAHNHFFRPVDE